MSQSVIPDPSNSDSVSSTLLRRLRSGDNRAWERLCDLYGPVVYRWCLAAHLAPHDAADVMQEVFGAVSANIGPFRRDRPGDSFRAWLATISRRKICDHFRRLADRPQGHGGDAFHEQLQNLPDPNLDVDDESVVEENEGVVSRARELVRAEFEPRTWTAFWRTVVEGQAPSDVAGDLGVSVNAVYKAKSRVLRRLRDELAGLVDEASSEQSP